MVYGIVKQSGGFIFVDSTLGAGAVFSLYFPVFDGEAASEAAKPDPRSTPLRQGEGVVLLVEDESDVVDLLRYHLRKAGFKVLVENSGSAGLEAVRQFLHQLEIEEVVRRPLDFDDRNMAVAGDGRFGANDGFAHGVFRLSLVFSRLQRGEMLVGDRRPETGRA
jgi:CheY-like chemotaxis protein